MVSPQNKMFNLVADIGGTNARFALVEVGGECLEHIASFKVTDYDSIDAAILAYLDERTLPHPLHAACLAIACPTVGDQVNMTNHSWSFSKSDLLESLNVKRLEVVNDYTALAYAVPCLQESDLVQVGAGKALAGQTRAIVGPGTGLGVGGLVSNEQASVALVGEGGHVEFAPTDEREIEVLRYLWRYRQHVSVEYLLSGSGLSNIHQALASVTGQSVERLTAAAISEAALTQNDRHCSEALECFCAMLGSVAGNVALTLGARGGVYIAGGIIPRILPFFANSQFRSRFEAKGRYREFMEAIPTRVITANHPGLLGAAAYLR